jgi:phosphodiesterase/alkaline phosphatase D-like protein
MRARAAAAVPVALAIVLGTVPGALANGANARFSDGVAAGDVTASSAILWATPTGAPPWCWRWPATGG